MVRGEEKDIPWIVHNARIVNSTPIETWISPETMRYEIAQIDPYEQTDVDREQSASRIRTKQEIRSNLGGMEYERREHEEHTQAKISIQTKTMYCKEIKRGSSDSENGGSPLAYGLLEHVGRGDEQRKPCSAREESGPTEVNLRLCLKACHVTKSPKPMVKPKATEVNRRSDTIEGESDKGVSLCKVSSAASLTS